MYKHEETETEIETETGKQKETESETTETVCFICFELLNTEECMHLVCGKCYHKKCLETWWAHHGSVICPICNKTDCIPNSEQHRQSPIIHVHLDYRRHQTLPMKLCCMISPIIFCCFVVFLLLGFQTKSKSEV